MMGTMPQLSSDRMSCFTVGGNAVVAELDQQILRVADGVAARMVECVADVFGREMEVAAQAEGQLAVGRRRAIRPSISV